MRDRVQDGEADDGRHAKGGEEGRFDFPVGGGEGASESCDDLDGTEL